MATDKKGHTLIEAIMVIALIGILIIQISSFFIINVKNTKRLSNMNELQYQAQVVNEYLLRRISHSKTIEIRDDYNMITLNTYMPVEGNWLYQVKRIMHKANGDIFEEGSELAVYAESMEFSVNDDNLVSYRIIFEKGKESYILENSVLMRNAIN